MAFVVKDRVRETTLTTGTGTITLAGAVIGYQTFSAIGNGNNTFYTIAGQTTSEWEVGIGTYTASGTTLSRDTVLASSNSGSAVNFSAGTKDVFVTYPAGKAIFQNNLDSVVVAANTSSDALRITQTGTGNAILVEDSANPDSTPFVVDANGVVGIGTTTPQSTFSLTAGIGIQSTGAFTPQIVQRNKANDSSASYFIAQKDRAGAIVQSGDAIGNIVFQAFDGASMLDAARITASVDGTPGTNDMPGRLTFNTTADGASGVTERMRIDSAGNVGIGAIPSYKLDVYGGSLGTTAGDQIIAQQLRVATSNDDKLEFSKIRVTGGSDWQTAGWRLQQKVDVTWQAYIQFNGSNNAGISFGTGTSSVSANSITERMRIDSAGNVGIGGASNSDSLYVAKNITGSTSSSGVTVAGTVQSTVTSAANYVTTYASTVAAFTLSNLYHYRTQQGTFSGTVTNQYGFFAESTLTGATNNYGFFSNLASGTGRWNFYANGTAANFFGGRVGIGDATDVGAALFINASIAGSGGVGYGIKQNNTATSTVTSTYHQNQSTLYTQAASFTLNAYKHFTAEQGSIGAGSTVSNQYGFIVESSLTGATNNFGFFSNIASGSGRWNFYAGGTAQNYFAGTTLIGTTTNTNSSTLVVNGTISATVGGTQYLVVDQSDIGTGANEIPLNQYLGANAYVDTETPALNIGTGITTGTGTICRANGGLSGGIYRMTILIDLTGLNSGGTAGDIIGVNGTALPCYIAQLPAMTVLGGRMTCLETPAGGDTDIDLYSATEGTGVEDQAITALTETQIINAGAQTRGTVTYFSADPVTNEYFYFVGQGTANATYTAGRFLIEVFGA